MITNKYDKVTRQEGLDLFKALSTGNYAQAGVPTERTGGSVLIPESLETTTRNITFTEDNLKLWKQIPKLNANSTVEQYNVVRDYGVGSTAFARESSAGRDTSSVLSRELAKVKFLTTTRSVTQVLNTVAQIENAEAFEINNGIKYILGQAEQNLFYGDSTLAPKGEEGLEWNGVLNQVDKANHIDLKGKALDDKVLNRAGEIILNNYGTPSKAYMPIGAAALFSENFYPEQRALMNVAPGTITAGTVVTQFNSIGGTVDVEPDVFMRRGTTPLDLNKPAIGDSPTPPEVTALDDEKVATFEEGTYKYAVVAVNELGETAPIKVKADVAKAGETAKKAVKLTIKNNASQTVAPEFFIIYRTRENSDVYYEIARIGVDTQEAGGETIFVDDNSRIPGTGHVLVGDFRTDETIAFKQLADVFKIDYAMVSPVKRFGIFLYGTPIVYAPKKFVVLHNVDVKRG